MPGQDPDFALQGEIYYGGGYSILLLFLLSTDNMYVGHHTRAFNGLSKIICTSPFINIMSCTKGASSDITNNSTFTRHVQLHFASAELGIDVFQQ